MRWRLVSGGMTGATRALVTTTTPAYTGTMVGQQARGLKVFRGRRDGVQTCLNTGTPDVARMPKSRVRRGFAPLPVAPVSGNGC